MYNKTKRGIELAGAIIGICLGALEIILGLVSTIEIAGIMGSYGHNSELTIILVACIGDIIVGSVMVAMGAGLCSHPKKINGEWEKRNGKRITLIVFVSLMVILYLISGFNGFRILMLLVALTALALIITGMCLKAEVGGANKSQVASNPVSDDIDNAVANKINELKRLKELGVITPEQYEMAIDKLLKDSL